MFSRQHSLWAGDYNFIHDTLLGTNISHLGTKNHLQKCLGRGYVFSLEGTHDSLYVTPLSSKDRYFFDKGSTCLV